VPKPSKAARDRPRQSSSRHALNCSNAGGAGAGVGARRALGATAHHPWRGSSSIDRLRLLVRRSSALAWLQLDR